MNRITSKIHKMQQQIADRLALGETTKAGLKRCHKELDMTFNEFSRFQSMKSNAMLQGLLTEAEAQSVYAYLGETPTHFNRQPIAVKAVLTQLFKELLLRSFTEAEVVP